MAYTPSEQAKAMKEAAEKYGEVLPCDQELDVRSQLLKGIESGEIKSVVILDKEHGGIVLDEIKKAAPDIEITMLQ